MKIKIVLGNTALILVSVFFALLLVEIFGLFLFRNEPKQGLFLLTKNSMKVDSYGAWRYQPNKSVRLLAVYGNRIEYDVIFDVNNIGLIQKNDIESSGKKEYIAIVGDSFTAGVGASPWFSSLQESLKNDKEFDNQKFELLNLGMPGTGLENFERYLHSISNSNIQIKKVIIIAISDDFLRDYRYPAEEEDGFHVCAKACSNKPLFWSISTGDQKSDILSKVQEIYEQLEKTKPLTRKLVIRRLYSRGIYPNLKSTRRDREKRIEKSLTALNNIVVKYQPENVALLQLPEKGETMRNRYYGYSDLFLEKIKADKNIAYYDGLEMCGLTLESYHHLDGHPNQQGYEKIEQCVSPIIKEMATQ